MIGYYRKRPITVRAVQWTGTNFGEVEQLARDCNPDCMVTLDGGDLWIITLEGQYICAVDNWIIRGIKDELYPCAPDVFEHTYEPVLTCVGGN